jgi:hypothetical protein
MQRSKSIREVLEALEWVRREMMNRGSPDFIRQRQLEARVGSLCSELARGNSGMLLPIRNRSPKPTRSQHPKLHQPRTQE